MSGIILRSRAPFKICDSASLLHYFNTVLVVLTKDFVSTISVLVLSHGQPELQHSTCRLDKRGLSPLFLFLPCLLDNQHLSSWQRSLPPLFSVLALSHRQPLNPLSWSMPIPCIGSTMLLSPDNTTRSCSTKIISDLYLQNAGKCRVHVLHHDTPQAQPLQSPVQFKLVHSATTLYILLLQPSCPLPQRFALSFDTLLYFMCA